MTVTDNRTPNFDIPLPNSGNKLPDDLDRLVEALTLIDTRLQEIVNQQQSPDAGTLGGQSLAFVLALANATGVLPIAKGGTGATDAAGALAALGFDAAWDAKFAARLDALPELLDTLAEITAAIQNNESVGTALTSQIASINAQITTILATQALKASLHASGNALIIPSAADGDAPDPTTAGLLYRSTDDGKLKISSGSEYDPLGGSGLTVQAQTFTSSGTWTKPAGLAFARVIAQGAGGSGPGIYNPGGVSTGWGGAAGGYAEKTIMADDLGETETVTIGAGGVAVAAGGSSVAGNPGGTTSFGSHVSATGGVGGTTTVGQVTHNTGANGIGTGGDINLRGGSPPKPDPVEVDIASGGRSPFGGEGVAAWPKNAEANTGSGGCGASIGNIYGRSTGGNGADGIAIVIEYIAT